MLVPNRHGSSNSYRYGFQGQEKDDELKGEGNSLNYTFRMHDPRVGRFFAVDPLTHKYPWYSPYQFGGNKPISFIELEGLEESTTLWHGTSIENMNGIINSGFNATENGKYSNYNWFATAPKSADGGAGASEVFVQLKGIDTKNAHKISIEQTTVWKQEIMKEMKISNKQLTELMKSNSQSDKALYKEYMQKIYGNLYSKIGVYMDKLGKDVYFLEKDNTYAVSDRLSNSAKRIGFKGKVTELFRSRTVSARTGESAYAKAVAKNNKFSFLKFGKNTVLLVAVAADVYEVYTSEDKSYTVTKKIYQWSYSAMGAYAFTTLAAGQAGPQALIPEEAVTVPIAGILGGITGYLFGEVVHEVVHKYSIKKGF